MSLPNVLATAPTSVARRLPLRAAVVVGLVLVAYNYSLGTLFRGLSLQTPLAYLALVPVIAFILGVVRVRLSPPETEIHDRQLDWIVGLAFLGATGAILILAPQPADSGFWLRRVDLLTLPLYVSGLVALLFGVRRLWTLRVPILFLLLAWPLPFTWLLSVTAEPLTDLTASTVGLITSVLPVARPAVGDPTLFLVGSGDRMFGVSIGTACSGVNSFVGFLLLGAATLFVVRGGAARRVAWLATGLVVTIGLNVARILAILVVGANVGEEAALDILHPVAGLLVFNVGVLIMLLLVPRFGLRFARAPQPAERASSTATHLGGTQIRAAVGVALVIALALGVTNAAFARYETISTGLADARLAPFPVDVEHVDGWKTSFIGDVSLAEQYFGDSATWQRFAYRPTPDAALTADRTLYVDVLTTKDPGTFSAYGLEACYTFHGYEISSVADVDIGAGVSAQVIDYTNRKSNIQWSALWWEWPYTDTDGSTRYERVVVFMADGPQTNFRGMADLEIATQDPSFEETDRFLATVGLALVERRLATTALTSATTGRD